MIGNFYTTTMRLATPLVEHHLRRREELGKEDALRGAERRGHPSRTRDDKPLVWFHAASVGESLSLLSVISRLLADAPFIQALVTTGTVTSAKLMAERLPEGAFHQYMPVDHPVWVEAFLDHWRPDLIVWAESDFWPAMLLEISRRKIPAVLLNARMSERSFRKWLWVKSFMRRLLSPFALCLAQNEDEARRLTALGAVNVKISANLKYAASPLPFNAEKLEALQKSVADRPLILWASTHAGEEIIAARTHEKLKEKHPNLLTIIVPRHPQRGQDIRAVLEKTGLKTSQRTKEIMPAGHDDIYLADTLGELGLFYRLSKTVVLGGSFVDVGGHNPIEPGQCGCAIFYGPIVYNFQTICADFETRHAACRVQDEESLCQKLTDCLDHPKKFLEMAEAARTWTTEKSHVVEEIAADLAPYMKALRAKATA